MPYKDREKKRLYAIKYREKNKTIIQEKEKLRHIKRWTTSSYRIKKTKTNKKWWLDKNGKYFSYQKSAKVRNIFWELSFREFILFWQKPCFYCGDKIETIGIDRKDNDKGYIPENIISCCFKCNKMKNTMNIEEFISHCLKITKRYEI